MPSHSSVTETIATVADSAPSFEQLRDAMLDLSEPVGKRTRAIFYLRSRGGLEDLRVLLAALRNRQDSELMRHELAYVIGQFQMEEACDTLHQVLADATDDGMVRHEAAEALGAIGAAQSLPVLDQFSADPAPEVADTCKLAASLVQYKVAKAKGEIEEGEVDRNPYLSEDPAPAAEKDVPTAELRRVLLDHNGDMFAKYRAMFSLRNRNTEEAALALAEAFDDPNALFKHEVAYVMGQMENPVLVPALKKVLLDETEHRMVRHEAAEALGAIGTTECEEILKQYLKDDVKVVRESCEVALDIMDYWAPAQ
ncbi:deoxyhypusine hydroxylase [Phytophthora pseudosyringae]|uniref:Deoxyhypusine hydroxylase n=1 Tax=Phytophthora pseudosyringae TaxID=221518 RepID=A0A8T1VU40_9STRA|nr:deoxyhypusine hydroxylase [Phytophthora pseudosyringae]